MVKFQANRRPFQVLPINPPRATAPWTGNCFPKSSPKNYEPFKSPGHCPWSASYVIYYHGTAAPCDPPRRRTRASATHSQPEIVRKKAFKVQSPGMSDWYLSVPLVPRIGARALSRVRSVWGAEEFLAGPLGYLACRRQRFWHFRHFPGLAATPPAIFVHSPLRSPFW